VAFAAARAEEEAGDERHVPSNAGGTIGDNIRCIREWTSAAHIFHPRPATCLRLVWGAGTQEAEWTRAENTGGAPWRRMLVVLRRMEGRAFLAVFLIKLTGDAFRFITPAALQQIIQWMADEDAQPPFWAEFVPPAWRGIYYVFVMTAATMIQCFCYSNSNLRGNRVGVHVRSAITVSVYKKSLTQALCARGETTTGKLVNLIASDATRVMWSIPWLHFLPCGMFQVIGAILFLYSLLGPAVLAGLAVTLVSAPLMSLLVKKNNQCEAMPRTYSR
jgi:ABC-type multidrug transport system fused ATPase/permease subunit